MVDIQSPTVEIRRGKKEEEERKKKKPHDENIMSALLHRATIIKILNYYYHSFVGKRE